MWHGRATHWGLTKITNNLKKNIECIFIQECVCLLNKISLKYVSKVSVDNKSWLVQLMAWCRIGVKSLPEQMAIKFEDTILSTRFYMYAMFLSRPIKFLATLNPEIHHCSRHGLIHLTGKYLMRVPVRQHCCGRQSDLASLSSSIYTYGVRNFCPYTKV